MAFPTITGIVLTNILDAVYFFVPFKVDIGAWQTFRGHSSDEMLPGFFL